ncbi:hypothetical protein, partial [Bacillus paralicheniformis]|uniref:hypothetical protein n=1 Tax=Bacillus paralicheniformis TaxID=1648923 RepID=UPI00196B92BB
AGQIRPFFHADSLNAANDKHHGMIGLIKEGRKKSTFFCADILKRPADEFVFDDFTGRQKRGIL